MDKAGLLECLQYWGFCCLQITRQIHAERTQKTHVQITSNNVCRRYLV